MTTQFETATQSEAIPLVSNPPNQAQLTQELRQWLTITVQLPRYYDNFVQNGFSSLNIVKCIHSNEELAEIGIKLKGHQLKIMSEIRNIQQTNQNIVIQQTNQNVPPSAAPDSVTDSVTSAPQKQITPDDAAVAAQKKLKTYRIIAFAIGAIASFFLFIGLCVNNLANVDRQITDYDYTTLVCGWTEIYDSDGHYEESSYADVCEDGIAGEEDPCVTMGVAYTSLILLLLATICSITATILVQPFWHILDIDSLKLCEEQTNPPRALFISAAVLGWASMIVWVAGDQHCLNEDYMDGHLGSSMALAIVGSIFCMIAIPLAKHKL